MQWPSQRALVSVKNVIVSSYVTEISTQLGLSVAHVEGNTTADLNDEQFHADLAVIELVPTFGPSALDFLTQIRAAQARRIPAVLISDHRSPYLVQDDPPSLRDCSYLVKADITSLEVVRNAIDRAARGLPGIHHNNEQGIPALTRNQAATLRLVASGLSNAQIAIARGRSVRAVELTIARLYTVLGVDRDRAINSRVAATLMYHQSGVTVR